MPSVTTQIKALPPNSQVKLCCVLAMVFSLMGALFLLDWKVYEEPVSERIVQLDGTLTRDAEVWKPDSTIVDFAVAPQGRYEDRQVVFAYKDVYQATGLRRGAKVLLLVEDTAEGALIRKLTTLEGRVLFDDNMRRHVVSTGNNTVLRTSALTVFLVTLCLGHAFLTWWRHLRGKR